MNLGGVWVPAEVKGLTGQRMLMMTGIAATTAKKGSSGAQAGPIRGRINICPQGPSGAKRRPEALVHSHQQRNRCEAVHPHGAVMGGAC